MMRGRLMTDEWRRGWRPSRRALVWSAIFRERFSIPELIVICWAFGATILYSWPWWTEVLAIVGGIFVVAFVKVATRP